MGYGVDVGVATTPDLPGLFQWLWREPASWKLEQRLHFEQGDFDPWHIPKARSDFHFVILSVL